VESLGGVDLNAELQGMIDEGELGLLLEFPADVALPTYGPFTLSAYFGKPDANPGEWLIDPQSYDPSTGKPLFYMEGSSITDGALVAGPGDFAFPVPVMGMVLNLKIAKAEIHGTVAAADAAGVELIGGAVGGEISKDDVIAALEGAHAWCVVQGADAPKECSYLDMLTPELLDTFIAWDLDQGTGSSFCAFFSGIKARIKGLAPASP
jgi:hypothetical protein